MTTAHGAGEVMGALHNRLTRDDRLLLGEFNDVSAVATQEGILVPTALTWKVEREIRNAAARSGLAVEDMVRGLMRRCAFAMSRRDVTDGECLSVRTAHLFTPLKMHMAVTGESTWVATVYLAQEPVSPL